MKKLLLLLFACILPACAMEKPKRKRSKSPAPLKITYSDSDQTAITPQEIIAFDNDTQVGYIWLEEDSSNSKHGFISGIGVIKTYRRQGIGYELFKRAIFALQKKGFRIINWYALSDDENIEIEKLEETYFNFIKKLTHELEFDFVVYPREGDEQADEKEFCLTPMKIIIKNNGAYPEGI